VILQAIEHVGRADRAAITEAAFATCDFDGALGRWSFDTNGDIDLRRGTRLTIRHGHFEPLNVLAIEEDTVEPHVLERVARAKQL
jgi:hypothetical protein